MSAVIEAHASQAPAPAERMLELVTGAPDRVVAYDGGVAITRHRFERHVRALAVSLPAARYAVNLCEDRYRFIVALCAAALRGQVTLLPSSRAPAVINGVLAHYDDAICIGDTPLDDEPPRYWCMPRALDELDGAPLRVPARETLLIGFTSGSTGTPTPNPKTLESFAASTAQNLQALHDLAGDGLLSIVATSSTFWSGSFLPKTSSSSHRTSTFCGVAGATFEPAGDAGVTAVSLASIHSYAMNSGNHGRGVFASAFASGSKYPRCSSSSGTKPLSCSPAKRA